MGMATHLAALAMFVLPSMGNIIGPLIVWLIKKDTMPFVDDQGKESLNFQITVSIAILVCAGATIATCFVLIPVTGTLIGGLMLADLVFIVIAAIKANEGVRYRYPINIRFIK